MVTHVPIIGIMMIVQGSLSILMGLLYVAMGPLLSKIFEGMPQNNQAPPPPQEFFAIMTIVYVVIGVLVMISGLLNVIAGIRGMKFRGRTFMIVALFANLLPAITCYCAPTGIGLIVYGLVVLFQVDVARAFEMGTRGASADEIKEHFQRAERHDDDDRYDDDDDALPPPPSTPPPPDEGFRRAPD